MEKLLKIKGYYNRKVPFDFDEQNSWEGHVILREDLTFEGIVNDYSSQDKDRLIFGTLVDYNGTSLMKFTNGGFCPCSFFGVSTGKEVLGYWSSTDSDSTIYQGKSKIIFEELPMDDSLVTDLKERIESFKSEISIFNYKIYNSFTKNIDLTVKQFFQDLETNRKNLEIEVGAPLRKLEL